MAYSPVCRVRAQGWGRGLLFVGYTFNMNHRSRGRGCRTGANLFCLLVMLLALPACKKATFEENYRKGLENVKQGKFQAAEPLLERANLQNPTSIDTKYQ